MNKQVREQLKWIHKKVDQDKGLKYTSNILHIVTFHMTVIFKTITMTCINPYNLNVLTFWYRQLILQCCSH